MSGELATIEFTSEQVDLVKRTICRGASNDELALFVNQCKRTGLDPFSRQIHAVKRWDAQQGREVMSIQTGIDGFRLIAERTGKYAGNDDPVYDVENAPHPNKATVTVWKMVNGARVPFSRSARWTEFVQTKKGGEVTKFWAKMPYLMLGKVAEALALRAAFPQELSGLYTSDEIPPASDNDEPHHEQEPQRNGTVTELRQIPGVKSGADLKAPRDIPGEFAACNSLSQLGAVWGTLNHEEQRRHLALKDKRKAELQAEGEQSQRPTPASSATGSDATAPATPAAGSAVLTPSTGATATTTSQGTRFTAPATNRRISKESISDLVTETADRTGTDDLVMLVAMLRAACPTRNVDDGFGIDDMTPEELAAADAWLRKQPNAKKEVAHA